MMGPYKGAKESRRGYTRASVALRDPPLQLNAHTGRARIWLLACLLVLGYPIVMAWLWGLWDAPTPLPSGLVAVLMWMAAGGFLAIRRLTRTLP